jgi:hypothetical protein
MQNDKITPLLLSPIADDTEQVQYRYPVALDDGTAFVTGIVGAEGPTYKLDLNGILP